MLDTNGRPKPFAFRIESKDKIFKIAPGDELFVKINDKYVFRIVNYTSETVSDDVLYFANDFAKRIIMDSDFNVIKRRYRGDDVFIMCIFIGFRFLKRQFWHNEPIAYRKRSCNSWCHEKCVSQFTYSLQLLLTYWSPKAPFAIN